MSSLFEDDGCVDIQDLYKWRNKITDVLQEYADNPTYYDGYVFAVFPSLHIEIVKANTITEKGVETFNLDQLVHTNSDGTIEVDCDKVDELSDQFMFVAR